MFNFKKKTLSEEAQLIQDIAVNFATNKAIRKLISPISDDCFLIDDKNQITVCISDGEIILANHTYLYKKMFNISFTDSLKKRIKQHLESEMQQLKKTLLNNEINLLDKVKAYSKKEQKALIINHNFKSGKAYSAS